jgi:hypothetical protein
MNASTSTRFYMPIAFWVMSVLLVGSDFRQNQWECLLVIFAALVLVPLGLKLLEIPQDFRYTAIALGFCAAYFFEGFWFLSLPYLLWATWLTLREGTALLTKSGDLLHSLVRVFALGFWATGASFAVFYLAGYQPFGFDLVIISLTAAHFHVAGFVLAVLVFLLLRHFPNPTSTALGWAALLGMPLVAAGITLTQLGFPAILEQVSALGFVLFAGVLLVHQLRFLLKPEQEPMVRYLGIAGATCLLAGLVLAGIYALRFQFPIHWASIPNLKIWHGTLNTLGFAFLTLLAWDKVGNKP